jgi:hypothetical protein
MPAFHLPNMLQSANRVEIFLNMPGDVVLRQSCPLGDDNLVVIAVDGLPELLARLQALIATPIRPKNAQVSSG